MDTKDFKASCSSMNSIAMDVADACPAEDFMITCKWQEPHSSNKLGKCMPVG